MNRNIIELYPHNPRNPANSAVIAFRRALIKGFMNWFNGWKRYMQYECLGVLPSIIPSHWTQERIIAIADGTHRPVYPGTITKLSNVRTGVGMVARGQVAA